MPRYIENRNSYVEQNIVSCKVPDRVLEEFGLHNIDLPQGYYIVGGAARSVAFAILHPNDYPPPIRDLDIGYILDQDPDTSLCDEISAKYMQDDYNFGHGAQATVSIESYMNARDFTMNQVILRGNRLTMTKRAVDDIGRGIIRFAEYQDKWQPQDSKDNKFVKDKLSIKSELLRAVLDNEGYRVTVDPESRPRRSHDYFHLALFLQKAFEYGDGIPEILLNNLYDAGIFGDEIKGSVLEVMRRVNEELLDWPFDWRNEARELLRSGDALQDASNAAKERLLRITRCVKRAGKLLLDKELEDY